MARIRLTKNELRDQQRKWQQLQRYLPTLQLKKAMLQLEVNNVQIELENALEKKEQKKEIVERFSALLMEKVECNLTQYAEVVHVNKIYENIAGVEIPGFQSVEFKKADYSLFATPAWTDEACKLLREYVSQKEEIVVILEKKRSLGKELRDVSIRVNLFEKVLIPRSLENIKKIKIFLGDQQLMAIAQAKVAKAKIHRAKKYYR